jgi:hypothetical protein
MPLEAKAYSIAPYGMATAFEESELPDSYCMSMLNRFINTAGGAEKRRGIVQFGSLVNNGNTNITNLHEHVSKTGVETFYASGEGVIYKWDGASVWEQVYSFNSKNKIHSVQFDQFLIFSNGDEPPVYYDGKGWHTLESIVEEGFTATGTSAEAVQDTEITSWSLESEVVVNDLFHDLTLDSYSVISVIATASVGILRIGPGAVGGVSDNPTSCKASHRYRIIDLVENNIIPTSGGDDDNFGACLTGSSATGLNVWHVDDWVSAGAREGDWILNTTRSGLGRVVGSSGKWLVHTTIKNQMSGDSLIFFKPAVPHSDIMHVHYGRLYLVDKRDQTKIRISGDSNCRDFSTDTGILAASSFSFGAQQPLSDVMMAMTSYQRFLVMSGKQYTLLFEGTNPILDTSVESSDWAITGMFPQGVVSKQGLLTVGNDACIVTEDGLQSFSLSSDSATLARENLSEAIKTELRERIKITDPDEIIAFHYPRRSWVVVKIGQEMYVYNYTPYFGRGEVEQFSSNKKSGSWSKFDGPFASQNCYFVRRNGDLYCAGANGKVYTFDLDPIYTDDGIIYSTEYKTGWLKFDNTPVQRHVKYVTPTFDGAKEDYTIRLEAPFSGEANNTIIVDTSTGQGAIGDAVIGYSKIGGSRIVEKKIPVNIRGKELQITFSTDSGNGPDVLSRFLVFYTSHGLR